MVSKSSSSETMQRLELEFWRAKIRNAIPIFFISQYIIRFKVAVLNFIYIFHFPYRTNNLNLEKNHLFFANIFFPFNQIIYIALHQRLNQINSNLFNLISQLIYIILINYIKSTTSNQILRRTFFNRVMIKSMQNIKFLHKVNMIVCII
jgi:hypothetical protein